MAMSKKVQAARKQAQKARLKKKGDEDYPEYYASQPLQKVKAAANEAIRKANQDVANAEEDLQLAEITGEGLKEAQEGLVVARIYVEKLQREKRQRPGAVLSAAGGN